MVEVETTFSDSGYDCDHCGGQVLLRTDKETGQPVKVCYQCQECGCQWSRQGEVLRVGHMSSCHQALKEREKLNNEPDFPALTPILITVSIALLILMLVLLGGLVTVRFLIPIAIAVFVGWKIYELVKDKIRQ